MNQIDQDILVFNILGNKRFLKISGIFILKIFPSESNIAVKKLSGNLKTSKNRRVDKCNNPDAKITISGG